MPAEAVVFTSGATEANNLAIKGLCEARLPRGATSRWPPSCARCSTPAAALQSLGFELTVLPVQPNGLLDLEVLAAAYGPTRCW